VPVVAGAGGWRTASGARAALEDGRAAVKPDARLRQRLNLPRGRWELSLQYLSAVPLELRADRRLRARLAPQRGDASSYWRAGTLLSDGRPVTVELRAPSRRALDAERVATIGSAVAQRVDVAEREVPLRAACGSYVDWYRGGG
jgi:hypothetical protein